MAERGPVLEVSAVVLGVVAEEVVVAGEQMLERQADRLCDPVQRPAGKLSGFRTGVLKRLRKLSGPAPAEWPIEHGGAARIQRGFFGGLRDLRRVVGKAVFDYCPFW